MASHTAIVRVSRSRNVFGRAAGSIRQRIGHDDADNELPNSAGDCHTVAIAFSDDVRRNDDER
jgi:hypothetical protein